MSYATIEERVHSLIDTALDDDVSVTRGFHAANELKSVAVRPGRADRQQQGERGRLSHWYVEIALRVSSGLSLSEFHDDVLSIREIITSTLDAYPTLDLLAGVTYVMLESMNEPTYESSGRSHSYQQTCYVHVKEYATITTGEYA